MPFRFCRSYDALSHSSSPRQAVPTAGKPFILPTADPGTCAGTVTVLGGACTGDRDPLAQASFTVVVK